VTIAVVFVSMAVISVLTREEATLVSLVTAPLPSPYPAS